MFDNDSYRVTVAQLRHIFEAGIASCQRDESDDEGRVTFWSAFYSSGLDLGSEIRLSPARESKL